MSRLYLVEDCDGGGAEYSHLFELPKGMTPEDADLMLERVMAIVMEDFTDWNWDDAIRILVQNGWKEVQFAVASAAY